MLTSGTTLGTAATVEARIFLPTGANAFGKVFNEWENFTEDKQLNAGATGLSGYYHAVSSGTPINDDTALTLDTWHHIAFVYEDAAASGSEYRRYLDGTLVESASASGDISDGGGLPFIGAICRDGGINSSFLGYLDTIRVSNIARYSGSSFSAPTGDLTTDANTLVLFNFSPGDFFDDMGVPKVNDLSGNDNDGTLGGGCDGQLTSPTVAEEATPTPTATVTATQTLTPTPISDEALSPTPTSSPTSTRTNTPVPSPTGDLSAPGGPPGIPTLSESALALLAFGLLGLALFALRRR
jgi:hypothetical protein